MTKLFLILIILNITIHTVYSCSCMMPEKNLAELIKTYSNIFKATVADIKYTTYPHGNWENLVYFNNIVSIKGDNTESTNYATMGNGALCGVSFSKNETWLVYAQARNDKVSISLCSFTRRYQNYDDYTTKSEVNQLQALMEASKAKSLRNLN